MAARRKDAGTEARFAEPKLALVRQFDTHRLIPGKYAESGDSVLAAIADDDRHLQDIFEIDNATNERLHAEHGRVPEIGPEELVFGVPFFRTINAAFCHPNPLGSRFADSRRGAWYAGFELETSFAEVIFHKSVEYAEIDRWDDSVTYVDHLADFSASFHDLRRDTRFKACLDPASYLESQALAQRLLAAGSLGVVYPSVRKKGGTCLACFQPAVVQNVRRARLYAFTWAGTSQPVVEDRGPAP